VLFASAIDPTIYCKILDSDGVEKGGCGKLKQQNAGQCVDNKYTAEFTLSMCGKDKDIFDHDDVNHPTYLWIRGSAVEGTKIPWSSLPVFINGESCIQKKYSIPIDDCESHFNAQLSNTIAGSDQTNEKVHTYNDYMLRNCPLETTVECKDPDGIDCKSTQQCKQGIYEWKFCYRTTFEDHTIKIRTDFNNCNGKTDCRETAAWFNGFENTYVPTFGEKMKIGKTGGWGSCVKYSATLDTCVNPMLPYAFANVVGSVSTDDGDTTKKSNGNDILSPARFKACFDNDRTYTNFDITKDNSGDNNGGGGVDCVDTDGPTIEMGGPKTTKTPKSKKCKDKKSKSPHTHKSKAPSSKGSKAPSSKGGKGTKAPTTGRRVRTRY